MICCDKILFTNELINSWITLMITVFYALFRGELKTQNYGNCKK